MTTVDPARAPLREILGGLRPSRGSFSREVLQSLATDVALAGLATLSGIMLARLLGPQGRGELGAIQALALIVAALGQLGQNQAVVYFGGKDRGRVGRYAISAAALVGLVGVGVVVIAALITPWYLRLHSPGVVFAGQVYCLLLFANAVDGVAINTSRALHRIPLWNVLRFCPRALWVVLVAAFFVAGVADPGRIALTYLAAYMVVAVLMVVAVRRHLRGHWRPVPSLWPRLLRFGLPVAGGAAPRLLNQRLDQLLIAAALPSRALGIYLVAVAWSTLGMLPTTALAQVAFSKIAGMEGERDKRRFIVKATWAVTACAVGTAVLLGAATPLAIRWVFGEDFVEAIPVAWIMLLAGTLRSVAWMLQVGLQAVGRPMVTFHAQWVGLACLVPAMVLLIPRLGVEGAAWALVVAAVAALGTAWVLSRRELGA